MPGVASMQIDCNHRDRLPDVQFAIEKTWLKIEVQDYAKVVGDGSTDCLVLFEETDSEDFTFGWPLHIGYDVQYNLKSMTLGIDPHPK